MKRTLNLLLVLFFSLMSSFSVSAKDTVALNQIDRNGKRVGYWVVDMNNNPISVKSTAKWKEGKYMNGRKEGVWICYFEDGKTPRLIGEYADNRPAGAYFRFNRKGELQQASSVPRKISVTQSVSASNKVFTCKLNFENKEIVAGQVFFSNKVIKKNAIQFWVEKSLEAISSESNVIDFAWLNGNYDRLYARYLEVRSPKEVLPASEPLADVSVTKKSKPASDVANRLSLKQESAKKGNYFYPPTVRFPRVAKGLTFQPNGLNKLYTPADEIWIDGYFKNGQLQDGKIFIYDHDGVLLKVRVYKDGMYESDGVL